MNQPLSVDIWSDIACPWCYIGKRRLEAALANFPEAHRVAITWHSFQLDPSAPRTPNPLPYVERLAKKYGTSPAGAQEMIDRMTATAAAEGLNLDFARCRPSNTFDAHRLLHAAQPTGHQNALKERLFRAYLCEGQVMADQATLTSLAVEVGLDADTVAGILQTDQFADAVHQDLQAAGSMGVDGVPFFLFGKRYAVVGAQPPEQLQQALQRALQDNPLGP